MTLGALMGPHFDVRNFGQIGWPACARLPRECLVSTSSSIENSDNRTVPLSVSSSVELLQKCSQAMFKWQLTRDALAFEPHVVVIMLGTNDAMGMNWERCGIEGFELAMALLMRAMLTSRNRPLILVIEPPPVLGEIHEGRSCMATHTCRYDSKRCSYTAECTSCLPDDSTVRSRCIWIPQLKQVRVSIRAITSKLNTPHALRKRLGLDFMSSRGDVGFVASECLSQTVKLLPPLPIRPDPDLYQGPIHLNARGSALIACAVHSQFRRCGSESCPGSRSAAHNASLRHARLCEPYFARYVWEPKAGTNAWHSSIENSALGPHVMSKSSSKG